MKKYLLEIVVFICGAAVMIFELAGSRLVAPYLGTISKSNDRCSRNRRRTDKNSAKIF